MNQKRFSTQILVTIPLEEYESLVSTCEWINSEDALTLIVASKSDVWDEFRVTYYSREETLSYFGPQMYELENEKRKLEMRVSSLERDILNREMEFSRRPWYVKLLWK